jgi:glycosyltransferase involved in cell wall biosynthesis
MACEVPVVATRVGALDELVTEGVDGRLVTPDDATALAGAIDAMVANPAGLAAAGRAARQTILSRFTIERTVRETEALITSVL